MVQARGDVPDYDHTEIDFERMVSKIKTNLRGILICSGILKKQECELISEALIHLKQE